MILAVDVDYKDKGAVVAGVLFENWEDATPVAELTVDIADIAEYVPGEFYKRELPCINALLDEIEVEIDFIIIDGYVDLGEERKPGLGRHLWTLLNGRIPVIGVAKSAFKDTPKDTELLRGNSRQPLYITSAGINVQDAKHFIQRMHGKNRLPTLLKRVDALSQK